MIDHEPHVQSLVRVAAISDTHFRGREAEEQDAFGFLDEGELICELSRAAQLGANILFLLGDITDRGLVEPAKRVGEIASAYFPQVEAIGGNHDSEESMKALQKTGVDVLEHEVRKLEIGGLRIGIYGYNGSLPNEIRDPLRGRPWDEQTPVHYAYTEKYYHPLVVEGVQRLIDERIDVLFVLCHIPLLPGQTSDSVQGVLREMTPKTGEFIEGIGNLLKVVIGGHVHSLNNPAFGRNQPIGVTENGTVFGNFATQNARRARRHLVTIFDICRAPDGRLVVEALE